MLKPLLKPLISEIQKFKVRNKVNALLFSQNPKIRAIGEALHESLAGAFSTDELQWINAIETQRSQLLNSHTELSLVDYGAGAAHAKRSKEEMIQGVHSTTTVSRVCDSSKNPFWSSFLFKLIRKTKPSSCVELGSCVGISASYLAAAIKLNGTGQLQSLEGSAEVAAIARKTLSTLALKNAKIVIGPFHETFNDVLKSNQKIDFLFNDGHHDYEAVINYFQQSLPYLVDEAIVVIDDISWSQGMRKAWEEIADHEQVSSAIDLKTLGIVIVGNSRTK